MSDVRDEEIKEEEVSSEDEVNSSDDEDEHGDLINQAMVASETPGDLVSFLDEGSDSDINTRKLVAQANRKKKKSGGFQSMGLNRSVFKGIIRRGYKVPTPIQRKCIPLVMDGKDIVAMARTGSGKTAAFLIPMFEKLQTRFAQAGARALILSPTRELAQQTVTFIKELGRFTNLKSACILGGDSMDEQFEVLHGNPDIIVATPGRLMHVLIEMELRLSSVEYVVFDEADRLFELGFHEQLKEIMNRLSSDRQTLLFSATLPKQLVEFAKAGLSDPILIRLDVDSKLSENLKLAFLHVREEDKIPTLLHMLRHVVKPHEQTLVFVPTKHHVEYVKEILLQSGIDCSFVYSSLDQTARKINIGKFRAKKTMILVVTDVAARGLDIPLLDNVINVNFPAKPKLFIHRVGRVARAGSSGTAYCFASSNEVGHLIDLHLFLGRTINFATTGKQHQAWEDLIGSTPQVVIDEEIQSMRTIVSHDVMNMEKVVDNAYKQYLRSRPHASPESIKRGKEILENVNIGIHPIYASVMDNSEKFRMRLLDGIKNYKPSNTIFEVGANSKNTSFQVMKESRKRNSKFILKHHNIKQHKHEQTKKQDENIETSEKPSNIVDIDTDAFSTVIGGPRPKRTKFNPDTLKSKNMSDDYINYKPKDHLTEAGLSMAVSKSTFESEASGAVLDLMGDDDRDLRKQRNQRVWDRKKKKYVNSEDVSGGSNRKVTTESGSLIKKGYKGRIYSDWKQKTKADDQMKNEMDEANKMFGRNGKLPTPQGKKVKSELKRTDQILKNRAKKESNEMRSKGGQRKGHNKKEDKQQNMEQRFQNRNRKSMGRGHKNKTGRGHQQRRKTKNNNRRA